MGTKLHEVGTQKRRRPLAPRTLHPPDGCSFRDGPRQGVYPRGDVAAPCRVLGHMGGRQSWGRVYRKPSR